MPMIPFSGSLEQFGELARQLADRTLRELRAPDADPQPFIVAYRPVDASAVVAPISGEWFSSGAAKRAMGQFVLMPMALGGADRIAIVSSTWTCRSDSPAGIEVQRLKEAGEPIPWFSELGLEGVGEDMMVWVASPGATFVWHAQITRSASSPPTLSTWELHPDADGHWFAALRDAWGEVPGGDRA